MSEKPLIDVTKDELKYARICEKMELGVIRRLHFRILLSPHGLDACRYELVERSQDQHREWKEDANL